MSPSWIILAWKEGLRRPVRTVVTVTGVALAMAALFTLLQFDSGYRRALKSELDRLGAHVLIVPKGCPYDAASLALHGANWPCYLKAQYLTELRAIPNVAAAVPALMHAIRDSDGKPAVFVGTDSSILQLKPHWRVVGEFPKSTGEILIGSELAKRHGWKMDALARLPGQADITSRVTGIVDPTGGADDYFIHLPLAEAQRIFRHEGELTHVLVRLADPSRLEETLLQFRSCNAGMSLNVVPLAHLFRTMERLTRSTRWLLGCLVAVALVIAAAGVCNALLMAVSERTHELGLFRALGASTGDIFRLVQMESMILCGAGAALGLLVSWLGGPLMHHWLRSRISFVPQGDWPQWSWPVMAAGIAGALLLGGLAAWLPAWRACSVTPRLAMSRSGGAR